MVPDIPLSVLDLAILGEGQSSAEALAASTAVAVHADALGYHRFWVAEHHGMPAVASTSPAVLLAHVAAVTERIRVGSGGVMLPNHPPLVVAEQFALLEALHPGRVDVGIGRAPGTDPRTAAALRRTPGGLGVEDFPVHVADLVALLEHRHEHLIATPAPTSAPPVILLGSSGYSAQLAGMLGLPFAFAHHFGTGGTLEAVAAYRDRFRPSAGLDRPHVIVTAAVVAADTDAEADRQANPARLMLLGLRTGVSRPLHTPEDAAVHPHLEAARALPTTAIVGTSDRVAEGLARLAAVTGADELMLSTITHGLDARRESLRLVARAWGLAGAATSDRAGAAPSG